MKELKSQIEYWIKSAKHDLETAESLFKDKHYDWCLFLSHLVLEKLLKAHYIKDKKEFPHKIHKLDMLAEKTTLNLSAAEMDFLKEINEFNLNTRYPDYKFEFYELCTKDFTKTYFDKIKDFAKCLLKKI